MKILADENMPLVTELFKEFGDITLKHGRKIEPADLKDIDVLLVRSITKVNDSLLSMANNLQFVGTATAGFDHIDIDALKRRNITFSNAQGCNKISVGEYVLSGILYLAHKFNLNLPKLSIGVIGAGCTGSEVIKRAKALGLTVLVSDPPLKESDSNKYHDYLSFEECLKADIVTFHVPLTKDGKYPTYHMLNEKVLAEYFAGQKFIINASRGEVCDDFALLNSLKSNKNLHLIKDVWEGEPNISCKELINYALISTPHIAGYSYEGKCRGTYLLYQKLCQMLNKEPRLLTSFLKEPIISDITIKDVNLSYDTIRRLVHLVYDLRRDGDIFLREFKDGESFDRMRKLYPERRELSSLKVTAPQACRATLGNLGFSCN